MVSLTMDINEKDSMNVAQGAKEVPLFNRGKLSK